MKKILALVTLLALLAGCSAEAAPAMYIEPAKLDEKEEAVAQLLGADRDQHLYDVVLDGTAKKVRTVVYELEDGEWHARSAGNMALKEGEKKARMAFGFEDLRGEYREAVQFEKDFSAIKHGSPEELDNPEGMSRTTALLSNRTEIIYGQEVPLAVQVYTTKNEVTSYDPEYFFHPEEYESLGYEHVYALTVMFSQEALS
ncbi:hypothetical protein [Oscillibacter sp.]|uniref:hypothetical protein n=1 Tax=Oscillibacter sp. TaxID=1945593 RepID=UPI002D804A2F|nr:hypothetical protein [Oscillibacter sp.]